MIDDIICRLFFTRWCTSRSRSSRSCTRSSRTASSLTICSESRSKVRPISRNSSGAVSSVFARKIARPSAKLRIRIRRVRTGITTWR